MSRRIALTAALAPGWLPHALLGIGMIVGGALAWIVAAASIMLPYEVAFLGMTQAELASINPRVLGFMAHDRVVLAGSMISIGVLYVQLAWYAARCGELWAWRVIAWSGAIGFASFLLFLGYGYFDPLHALVTVLLLPFYLLGLRAPPRGARAARPSRSLRSSLASGQLPMVAVGAGLVLAGLVIATVGVTTVFVPEDLAFMRTTRESLQAVNPRLIPLIAHDRAGLGGTLACNGLGVLLAALWGFRPGARWLWWTFVGSGLPGFVAALGVHYAVGYDDLWHLTPGLLAIAGYLAGLALSHRYLTVRQPIVAPA